MSRLTGRIAVVTAGTKGIGLAIAKRFAEEGAKVLICSRKANNVEEAVENLNSQGFDVKGMVCHVSNKDDRKKLFAEAAKLGGLDILVSNAAVNPSIGPVFTCTEEQWDKIFDVNLKASYLLAKEALPLIKKSNAGRIIFMSSVVGIQPILRDKLGAYTVSKTALLSLTKMASLELAPNQITVNAISPGIIQTKFGEVITRDLLTVEEANKLISLRRYGVPEDISGCAAFLASDDASYVTGENFAIAGGLSTRI